MKAICFIILITSFHLFNAFAHAEMYVLKPLTLFHSDDAVSLGVGSLEPITVTPDLYRPGELIEFQDRLSIWYERESVLNEADSKLSSSSKGAYGLMHGAIPVLGNSALAFSVRDFDSDYRVNEDNDYEATQDINELTLAFGVQPHSIITAGAGVRLLSGKSQAEGFYHISVSPVNQISFGYRQYVRNMEINSSLSSNEEIVKLEFTPGHEIKELMFRLDVPSAVLFNAALNVDSASESHDVTFILFHEKPMNITFRTASYSLDYFNTIAINDSPGGHVNMDTHYSATSLILQFKPLRSSRKFIFGIKSAEFSTDMAGKIDAEDILGFWEDLLAGDRFFNAHYSFKSYQYHLGIEYKINTRFILRGGVQYMKLNQKEN